MTLLSRRGILCGLVSRPMALAASTRSVLTVMEAMEAADDLVVSTLNQVNRTWARRDEMQAIELKGAPAVACDGQVIGWWQRSLSSRTRETTVFVKGVNIPPRSTRLEGYSAAGPLGVSSGGQIAVVSAYSSRDREPQLLVVNIQGAFVSRRLRWPLAIASAKLERISVSGTGVVVALGSPDTIEIVGVTDGATIYSGAGRFPKVSPDGKHVAFVNQNALYLRSLENDAMTRLVPDARIMGTGAWSPDGRFLLAGAWTLPIALEKRQIVIDTKTSEYAVIGKLGDGDYGDSLVWISKRLIGRQSLKRRK